MTQLGLCDGPQRVAVANGVFRWRGRRGEREEAGTAICEPTSSRSGLGRPVLSVSSSRQRRPSPSREAANFHRESPGLTVTLVRLPEMIGDTGTRFFGRGARTSGSCRAEGARGAGANRRGTAGSTGKARRPFERGPLDERPPRSDHSRSRHNCRVRSHGHRRKYGLGRWPRRGQHGSVAEGKRKFLGVLKLL